jgi:hypothetical protein
MADSPLVEARKWLAAKELDEFKHLVWVGKNVSIADVERWLRKALGE